MLKNIHCCDRMARYLEDPKVPLRYYPIAREYGLILKHSPAMQSITHCPWCGTKLPESLRDEYFDILKKEYGVKPAFDKQKDPFHFSLFRRAFFA